MEETMSTTEEAAIEESSEEFDDIVRPKERKKEADDKTEESTKSENKNDADDNNDSDSPDDDAEVIESSPVKNVSNEIFVEVSNAVRNNCNSNASPSSSGAVSALSSQAKTSEEKVYVNTASKLISAYARLNNLRNKVYDNNDVVTDEDIALLTSIEDGLSANVEIFLNTNTTNIMDSNFDYSNELNDLELSINNKIK